MEPRDTPVFTPSQLGLMTSRCPQPQVLVWVLRIKLWSLCLCGEHLPMSSFPRPSLSLLQIFLKFIQRKFWELSSCQRHSIFLFQLFDWHIQLDKSLPAPLGTIGAWLYRAEVALREEITIQQVHEETANTIQRKLEQHKVKPYLQTVLITFYKKQ